jgi:hypothetical protein
MNDILNSSFYDLMDLANRSIKLNDQNRLLPSHGN